MCKKNILLIIVLILCVSEISSSISRYSYIDERIGYSEFIVVGKVIEHEWILEKDVDENGVFTGIITMGMLVSFKVSEVLFIDNNTYELIFGRSHIDKINNDIETKGLIIKYFVPNGSPMKSYLSDKNEGYILFLRKAQYDKDFLEMNKLKDGIYFELACGDNCLQENPKKDLKPVSNYKRYKKRYDDIYNAVKIFLNIPRFCSDSEEYSYLEPLALSDNYHISEYASKKRDELERKRGNGKWEKNRKQESSPNDEKGNDECGINGNEGKKE